MTISLHPSISLIILGRSSMQHPVSAQSWSMYVFVDWHTLACPCAGFHRRTSLMSSSLLLQQCPACLVRLTRMVWVICGRWPYSCFFAGCCFHVLFRITRSILVQLPSSLFSNRLVRVQVVQPCSSTDTTTAWKNCLFNLSVRLDFHMIVNLFIAAHAFPIRALTSFSVEDVTT